MDTLGYAASAAVLATFLMRTMMPLRLVAILSNVLFLSYGFLQGIYPVFFLHVILLPINTWRLFALWSAPRSQSLVPPVRSAAIPGSKPFAFWFAVGVLAGLVGPFVLTAAAEPAQARMLVGHVIVDMQNTASWLAKKAVTSSGRGSERPGRAVIAPEELLSVNVLLAPKASFDVRDSDLQRAI